MHLCGSRFPGLRAGASSKARIVDVGVGDRAVFPRPSGRGLIEGRARARHRRLTHAFPRPSGRGLIEGTFGRHLVTDRPEFPRPSGRGLIEGQGPSTRPVPPTGVSPAFGPGPHRRGIDAAPELRDRAVSPAFGPGPHRRPGAGRVRARRRGVSPAFGPGPHRRGVSLRAIGRSPRRFPRPSGRGLIEGSS